MFRVSTKLRGHSGSTSSKAHTPNIQMTSSISTTSKTTMLLGKHAEFVEKCVKRRVDVGMEVDEVKELASELWTMHDAYAGDGYGSDEDELGEDEDVTPVEL